MNRIIQHLESKKWIIVIVLFHFNLSSGLAQLNSTSDVNSVLWEISGKELQEPSYIMGISDNNCEEDSFYGKTLEAVINKTHQIIFDSEITPEAKAMQQQLITQKANNAAAFSEEDQKLINEFLKQNYGADLGQLGFYKLFVLEILIKNKFNDCVPYDIRTDIQKEAINLEMDVLGLESPEEQIALFDEVSAEVYVTNISKMINNLEKYRMLFNRTAELYKNQNQSEMINILDKIGLIGSEIEQKFLKERHLKWFPKIEMAIKEKPSFIVVGNAHILPLGYDLISLLKKEGYTVRPIKIIYNEE